MAKHAVRRFDVHSELYPASSAIIIGVGVVIIAMGAVPGGTLCLLAGIGVGVAGAFTKTSVTRKPLRRAR